MSHRPISELYNAAFHPKTESIQTSLLPECETFLMPASAKNVGINIGITPISSENGSNWLQLPPLVGVLALCTTISCAFFSLAVLITSNNQPVDSWTIQPTVYLASASAIANCAIHVAHANAIPIAWWYRASRGATIRELERQWQTSSSLARAARHSHEMSSVVAATLFVALMIVDGPLLQRASSVVIATQSKIVTLNFSVAPEVPNGFSGYWQYTNLAQSVDAVQVSQDWMTRTPISLPVHPACQGTCVGKVIGPGVTKTNCSTESWPITYDMWQDPNATWGSWSEAFPWNNGGVNSQAFLVDLELHGTESHRIVLSEAASLNVGLIEVFNSSGKYSETKCCWVPAVLEYDVQFTEGNYVSILPGSDSGGRFISLANNTRAQNQSELSVIFPATMDFFTSYLETIVNANASAYKIPGSNIGFTGDFGTFNAEATEYSNFSNGLLDLNFLDPTMDIIHSLNEMMFRAAVMSATYPNLTHLIDPGLSVNQGTIANQTATQNVFHSDFRWFAAATALEALTVLVVLPMFWGWWTLASHLNMSPFGIGLAFNSPLLRNVDTSKGAAGVVSQLGDVHVQYGAMVDDEKGSTSQENGDRGDSVNIARMGITVVEVV